jgi:hypothetical protein
MVAEPLQVVDGGRTEGQRVALELVEDHEVSWW